MKGKISWFMIAVSVITSLAHYVHKVVTFSTKIKCHSFSCFRQMTTILPLEQKT